MESGVGIIMLDGTPVVCQLDSRGVAQGVTSDRDVVINHLIDFIYALQLVDDEDEWGNDFELAAAALEDAKSH